MLIQRVEDRIYSPSLRKVVVGLLWYICLTPLRTQEHVEGSRLLAIVVSNEEVSTMFRVTPPLPSFTVAVGDIKKSH